MTKHIIEVDIPDGEFCFVYPEDLSCPYLDDPYRCVLIVGDDSRVYWEDQDKGFNERAYQRIVKHKDCPSQRRAR